MDLPATHTLTFSHTRTPPLPSEACADRLRGRALKTCANACFHTKVSVSQAKFSLGPTQGRAHLFMADGRAAAASFCPSNDLRCMSLIDKNRRYGTEWVGRCFGGVCWNASLVNPRGSGARGPSAEVWHGTWGEAKYLLPIFNTVLGGTCMQPDGSRKVVVDGARRRVLSCRMMQIQMQPTNPSFVSHEHHRSCNV